MKTIGLTGGIGSGKTTVSQIFEQYGVPVFRCDDVAKDIQASDPRAIQGMKAMFGDDIYAADGSLDRRRVASIVFADHDALARLNAIIHPLVHEKFAQFAANYSECPLVLMESAILVQSGFYKKADFCVQVIAPIETRIARVIARDHATREQVLARIGNQQSDSEIARFCKYQICNEDLMAVRLQVKKIVETENN